MTKDVLKQNFVKAQPGRGRKRAEWEDFFYIEFNNEFDWLHKNVVRFNASLLRQISIDIIEWITHSLCKKTKIDPPWALSIKLHITRMLVTRFILSNNIVSRNKTVKLFCQRQITKSYTEKSYFILVNFVDIFSHADCIMRIISMAMRRMLSYIWSQTIRFIGNSQLVWNTPM